MRGRPTSAPVSLFPFLAVLMCTMGALIVLLVLVSAQVRDDAVAKARVRSQESTDEGLETASRPVAKLPEPAAPTPEPVTPALPLARSLPPEPDLAAMRRSLATLDAQQAALQKKLTDRRTRLADIQARLEAVRRENTVASTRREELEGDLRRAARQRDIAEQELFGLDADRQRILESIAASKKLIEEQKKKIAGGSEFVVVPFDGLRGTARRPIIIECTDRSIRLVSEDIDLTPRQLLGFTPGSNPLLAGTNAIVQFWSSYNSVQKNPESEPVPYVLLVVRPSGTVAFYLARKFLAEMGADYGYELVEEDRKFSAPPSDRRAREMALAAISEMLAAGAPQGKVDTFSESLDDAGEFGTPGPARRGTDGSLNDGSNGGGFDSRGGGGSSLSGMAESGRTFDSRALRHGRLASQSFFSSSDFRRHQSNAEDGGGTAGRSLSPGASSGSGVSGDGSGFRNGSGGEPSGLRSTPTLGTLGQSAGERNPTKSFEFSAGPDPLIVAPSSPDGTASIRPEPGGTGRTFDPSDRNPRTGLLDAVNGLDVPDRSQPGRSSNEEPGGAISGDPKRAMSETPGPSSVNQPRESDLSASEQTDPDSARNSIETTTHPLLRNPTNPGSSGQPAGAAPSVLPLPSSSESPQSARPPQPTVDLSRRRQVEREIRRQWGIRNPSGTIALEKSVAIRLDRDKVVIDGKYKITRTDDRSSGQIADWTLLAVDRVAREWGVPPERFYWVPAVTLTIDPGGDLLRGPLDDRLRRNGVSVETRFSDGAVPTEESRSGGTP